MSFRRVDYVLEFGRDHLDRTQSRNTEVDSIIAGYACSVIYAALEKEVVALVAERVSGHSSDEEIINYAKHAARKLIRSIKVSELAGVAGQFSNDCKVRFRHECDDASVAAWNAIVSNRHGIAHDGDEEADLVNLSTLTFADVERYYNQCLQVLESFRVALGLVS